MWVLFCVFVWMCFLLFCELIRKIYAFMFSEVFGALKMDSWCKDSCIEVKFESLPIKCRKGLRWSGKYLFLFLTRVMSLSLFSYRVVFVREVFILIWVDSDLVRLQCGYRTLGGKTNKKVWIFIVLFMFFCNLGFQESCKIGIFFVFMGLLLFLMIYQMWILFCFFSTLNVFFFRDLSKLESANRFRF